MKYLYGFLALFLLFSVGLIPAPALASTEALEWQTVGKPGDGDNNLVVSPSEVSDMAIGSDGVIYIIDSENAGFYRSLDGGSTWEDMTNDVKDEGVSLPASHVTVAPDDPSIVAVVTDDGTAVYLSTDGGTNWRNANVPDTINGTIQAIAISEEYTYGGDDYREIAIGTAEWADDATTGEVWVNNMRSYLSVWQNQNLVIDPASPGGEVSDIAYSPDYGDDLTILVVASTNSDVATAYQDKTWLCLLERDAGTWNNVAGYPVEIAPAGDGAGVTISTSLALPSDYSSEDGASRQLLVSFNSEPDTSFDDVYWLNDDEANRLDADGGAAIDISSIAYYGNIDSGMLLAGDANPISGSLTVQVRRTEEAFSDSPDWDESSVPPTGPGNAQVGWSDDGDMAYCGTGQLPGAALDESALSVSLDGDKWRQLGLMDTELGLADIAVTPDSDALFITTTSLYGPEGVWRSAGSKLGNTWERLLTLDTGSDAVILRLSQDYEDDDTIYVADTDGDLIAVTHNRGNSWKWCYGDPGTIVDMAVIDEETVYVAVTGGYFRKSTNGITTWQQPVETNLNEINMLAVVDEDTILVGGRDGDVAYSTDGGETFTKIMKSIGGGTGDVQVVADAGFAENSTIYAATDIADEGIWRWVIGESDEWEQIDAAITDLGDGQSIGSLTVGQEGTLYALRTEAASGTSGGVTRSLNALEADTEDIEFELVNDELDDGAAFDSSAVFGSTIPYLKLYADDEYNELWTIDTTTETIYRLQDNLCKAGPTATSPDPEDTLPVDSAGNIIRLTLGWEELAGATEYEAVIYSDAGTVNTVWTGTTEGNALNTSRTDTPAQLSSGITYYWRVRAIGPVMSPWSELSTINPGLGAGEWNPFIGGVPEAPANGATNVSLQPSFAWNAADWATGYEFVLARDSEFTDVVISMTGAEALPTTVWACDQELDYDTTYFWKVRAISATGQSEWSVSIFTTEAAPASAQPQATTYPTTATTATTTTPFYIYVIIFIGVALVVALLWLIVRTSRAQR